MNVVSQAWQLDPGTEQRDYYRADAQLAVEMAAIAAEAATEWARNAGVGEDDAAEAQRAALRARDAAERVRIADIDEEARIQTSAAWAAAESALAADQRVIKAIVQALQAA